MQASVSVLQSTASKWGPSTPDSLNVGLPLIDKHSLHMGNGSIARSIFVVALCKNVIKFTSIKFNTIIISNITIIKFNRNWCVIN